MQSYIGVPLNSEDEIYALPWLKNPDYMVGYGFGGGVYLIRDKATDDLCMLAAQGVFGRVCEITTYSTRNCMTFIACLHQNGAAWKNGPTLKAAVSTF